MNNELGWGDGRVDLTSRDEIELRIEMEEETRKRIEEEGKEKGQDPRGSMGEGGRGKIQIKMLGTDVRLEQARKGIGAVMCGKRKRLKGKEAEVGEKKKRRRRGLKIMYMLLLWTTGLGQNQWDQKLTTADRELIGWLVD